MKPENAWHSGVMVRYSVMVSVVAEVRVGGISFAEDELRKMMIVRTRVDFS